MTVIQLLPNDPDVGVIEMLEDLLERARSGEIVAIAGITRNTRAEFGEYFSDSAIESAISMIAYLRVLQMRFEREIPFE